MKEDNRIDVKELLFVSQDPVENFNNRFIQELQETKNQARSSISACMCLATIDRQVKSFLS